MCFNDGLLRAWLDLELDADEMSAINSHLAGCVTCRDKATLLQARVQRLADRFNCLSSDAAEPPSLTGAQLALARFNTVNRANIAQRRAAQLTTLSSSTDKYWTGQYWLQMLTKLRAVTFVHFNSRQLLIAGIILIFAITLVSVRAILPTGSLMNEPQIAQLTIVNQQHNLPSAPQISSIDKKPQVLNSAPDQSLTEQSIRPVNTAVNKARRAPVAPANDFTRPLAGQFKQRIMENGKRYLAEKLGYQTGAVHQNDLINDVVNRPLLTRPQLVLISYQSQAQFQLESAELILKPDFRLIPKSKN